MKFISLKIDNFLAIGDAPPISLNDEGLVLIQGVNHDDSSANSNGVGKSSVVDALCWVLYGETARGESGDAVVNNVAKKNCSVQVLLRDGDSAYRITRYRKHKEFKNSTVVEAASGEGALWVDLSKGTEKETQALITEIMGCSLDVFMAAIYAGQEVTPDLPKMTDRQLKLLIEEAAGVERIESAYELARARMNSERDKLSKAVNEIATVTATIATTEAALTKTRLDVEAFDAGRVSRAATHRDQAETHKKALVAFLTTMKGLDAPTLEKRLGELASAVAGHSERTKSLDALKAAEKNADWYAQSAALTVNTKTKEALHHKERLDNAEAEVAKPCTECGKPGDIHDLEDFKVHASAKLRDSLMNLKVCKEELEKFSAALKEATAAREAFERAMPDMSAVLAEHADVSAKLAKYAKLRADAATEKGKMEQQQKQAETVATEANPYTSALAMLEKNLGDAIVRRNALEIAKENCEKKVAIAEAVVKVFGPAGVRAHILDTVTPFLNERTGDYLSALSDGNIKAVWTTLATSAKGDLKEKFTIEVENDKGAKSFKGLSGGEKRKVRLATMLALQDLVASRATKPISLWLGDEIDDALDRSGLERLMNILERKARERGTVLVVSHNDLNSWIDRSITVTKRGGVSTIEGDLVA